MRSKCIHLTKTKLNQIRKQKQSNACIEQFMTENKKRNTIHK